MKVNSKYFTKQDILDFMHQQHINWRGTLAADESSIARMLGSSPYVVLTDCTRDATPNWHEDLYVMMSDIQFKICKAVDCKFNKIDFTTIDLTKKWVWFLVKRHKQPYAENVHKMCKERKANRRKMFLETKEVSEDAKQLYMSSNAYFSELQMLVLPFMSKNTSVNHNL